jgi:hypothetical protein
MADTANAADIMADTADTLARYRREADTSSAEARRNSVAAHREHIEIGVAANGAVVNGAPVNGAAVVNGAAAAGAAVIGIGTPLGAGAFPTHLTTAIILMGITLGIGTDLVIHSTGVGAFLTRTTAFILTGTILRIATLMIITIAPYQEGDSFDTWLFEIVRALERLGHVARFIVNANHSVVWSAGYWEIIADNLSKAGWSWGCVSTVDSAGRTIFVADAHRDGKRFVVQADEKLTAFVELESAIRQPRKRQ